MYRRCRFIVALVLCLCVFAYDTVSISSGWGGGAIAWADVTISSTFSDTAFIKVIKKTLKKSDADNTLTQAELDSVTYLDCSNAGVKDIIGIDSFTNLEILDLSGNTKLTSIATNTNTKLKSLDYSGCTDLSKLQVVRTTSPYTSNEALQYLNCSNTNIQGLTSGLTNNTKLRSLKMNELGGSGALNEQPPHSRDFSRELGGFFHLFHTYVRITLKVRLWKFIMVAVTYILFSIISFGVLSIEEKFLMLL